MVSFGPKLTGISLSVLGWVLSVISCGLPMWGVDKFKYNGYRDPSVEWWGLWMSCVSRSTGQMQCSFHQRLQAVGALSVLTITAGMLGVFIFILGPKCTNFIQNERVKARLMASSGGMFITAALVQLVPVVWLVCTVPWDYRYLKAGVALYLGWAASVLMLIGGSIICCICPPGEDISTKYNIHGQSYVEYSAIPRSTAQSFDNKRDEV